MAGSWALFLAVASFWNVPQGRVTTPLSGCVRRRRNPRWHLLGARAGQAGGQLTSPLLLPASLAPEPLSTAISGSRWSLCVHIPDYPGTRDSGIRAHPHPGRPQPHADEENTGPGSSSSDRTPCPEACLSGEVMLGWLLPSGSCGSCQSPDGVTMSPSPPRAFCLGVRDAFSPVGGW